MKCYRLQDDGVLDLKNLEDVFGEIPYGPRNSCQIFFKYHGFIPNYKISEHLNFYTDVYRPDIITFGHDKELPDMPKWLEKIVTPTKKEMHTLSKNGLDNNEEHDLERCKTYDQINKWVQRNYGIKHFIGIGFFLWVEEGYWKQLDIDDKEIDKLILDNMRKIPGMGINSNAVAQVRKLLAIDTNEPLKVGDPRYINFRNHMFDIKGMCTVPHNKDIFTTSQIKCDLPIDGSVVGKEIDWDIVRSKAPKLMPYLSSSLEANNKLIRLSQEMCGSCFTIDTRFQKAFFLKGKGANGKTVLLETLQFVLGKENCSNVVSIAVNCLCRC